MNSPKLFVTTALLFGLSTLACSGESTDDGADDHASALAAAGTPVALGPAPTDVPEEARCAAGDALAPADVTAAMQAKPVGTLDLGTNPLERAIYHQVGSGPATHWEKLAVDKVLVDGIEARSSSGPFFMSHSMQALKGYLSIVNATPQIVFSDLDPALFAWDAAKNQFKDPTTNGFIIAGCPLQASGDFDCAGMSGPSKLQTYGVNLSSCSGVASLQGADLRLYCSGGSAVPLAKVAGRLTRSCASIHATFDVTVNGKLVDRVLFTAKGARPR